ncbi:LacI family transcriptional regulator [Kineosporia rhizophila]|uniref:LacI family DNA-binding transcriptional regulator n=1 Tax=Kineosporia TaxID=49184 RepID=UPI001E34E3D7|nr:MULTISPECIES: LacI family DNA-binding transcriptional regulator [Kineosporia]MCE0535494.1 LacI family transcriptional regulator [Kineosporia rhizophila]GLY16717.1 hypothetical protein Kisp01_37320 [Kineosporia sp. NBRC 101677]
MTVPPGHPAAMPAGPGRAPTLHDVAARAGVSPATASRALHPGTRRAPSPLLRERVFAAARELGYIPNLHAQTLARGRSDCVALLVADLAAPFTSAVAAGVLDAASDYGLLVTMVGTATDSHAPADVMPKLRRQRVLAIVAVGRTSERYGQELAAFEETGGRAVAVHGEPLPIDTVLLEDAPSRPHGLHRESGCQALSLALMPRAEAPRRIRLDISVSGPDHR